MAQSNLEPISFKLRSDKRKELDQIGQSDGRDRSELLRAAVDTFLEIQNWQAEHIRHGLRDAEAGRVVDHSVVKNFVHSWRKKKPLPRPTGGNRKPRT